MNEQTNPNETNYYAEKGPNGFWYAVVAWSIPDPHGEPHEVKRSAHLPLGQTTEPTEEEIVARINQGFYTS